MTTNAIDHLEPFGILRVDSVRDLSEMNRCQKQQRAARAARCLELVEGSCLRMITWS